MTCHRSKNFAVSDTYALFSTYICVLSYTNFVYLEFIGGDAPEWPWYRTGMINLLCGSDSWGCVWSACGQHWIQYVWRRLDKYMGTYVWLYVNLLRTAWEQRPLAWSCQHGSELWGSAKATSEGKCLTFWSLLVTWCTNILTFNNCTFCLHCIQCFVFIWEQTATCTTYSINWLVFMTEMKSVYCAVRTGSLTKAVCSSSIKG